MPFTEQDFFAVFAAYNEAIWPLPIAAYLIGAVIVGLMIREDRAASILISSGLAVLWAINGLIYHAQFFAAINPLALWFAGLFMLEALFLGLAPIFFGDMHFRLRADARTVAGLGLIGFAMVLYPLWGWLAGHGYPAVPAFGVAPCPTTIFTIGVLITADWRAARWLLIVPAIWSVIGGSAAFVLGVPQDLGLIAALLVLVILAVLRLRGTQTHRA